MVPDLIEFRELKNDSNVIRAKIRSSNTFRGKATEAMQSIRYCRLGALAWAASGSAR